MAGIYVSVSAAATEFAVSRDTMRRTLSEAAVEASGTGPRGYATYRLRDVIRAFNGKREPEDLNPHLRLALARAIETEDRIRKTRGELCEAADVERQIGLIMLAMAQAFETAVDGLERDAGLSSAQADYLQQHFDRARENLANEIQDGGT